MNQKLKIIIALTIFLLASIIEIFTPYPRIMSVVCLVTSIDFFGAAGFFFLLMAMPISKPVPPEWFLFTLGLIIFSLLMAPFYIEIEVVSNMLHRLNMTLLIMFFGVAIYAFHTMYKRIKIKIDK